MIKNILKTGVLILASVSVLSACSKDDDSSKEQNYMQCGDRKTEIKTGFIARGEEISNSDKGRYLFIWVDIISSLRKMHVAVLLNRGVGMKFGNMEAMNKEFQ